MRYVLLNPTRNMNTLVPTNQVAPRFNLLNYERSAANKAAEQRAKIGVVRYEKRWYRVEQPKLSDEQWSRVV